MDFKLKYFEYKNKYFNLKKQYGGVVKTTQVTVLSESPPETNSNIFMPIILAPFENVKVTIDEEIERTLRDNHVPTFTEVIELVKGYYIDHNINLSNVWNLSTLYYFDSPPFHISGNDQEELLYTYARLEQHLLQIYLCIYGFETRANFTGKTITIDIIDNIYDTDINCWDVDNFYGDTINRTIKIASVFTDKINENLDGITRKLTEHSIDVVVRDHRDPKWTNKNQALIVFGDYDHKYHGLENILNTYNGYVIYFGDKYNEWYGGLISAFISFIKGYADRIENYIFYGKSMGGYAALYASVYFPGKNCICVAISPHTINYKNYRNKITIKSNADWNKDNEHGKPPLIQTFDRIYKDIPTILSEHMGYNTKIYIMIGKSECDDYGEKMEHLNLDLLHMGAVINYNNVSSIIYGVASHHLRWHINFDNLLNVISSEFTTLYRDQNEGNTIISERID
jgi:hypothetical protein